MTITVDYMHNNLIIFLFLFFILQECFSYNIVIDKTKHPQYYRNIVADAIAEQSAKMHEYTTNSKNNKNIKAFKIELNYENDDTDKEVNLRFTKYALREINEWKAGLPFPLELDLAVDKVISRLSTDQFSSLFIPWMTIIYKNQKSVFLNPNEFFGIRKRRTNMLKYTENSKDNRNINEFTIEPSYANSEKERQYRKTL